MRSVRLGDVCTKIGSGATPRGGSDVYRSHGTALIRSQNIYNDGFRSEGIVYIGDEHAAQLANVEVEAGDVLLNITGDSVARSCRAPEATLPARVNQHVAIIRPNEKHLDAHYLHYYLVSPTKQVAMLSLAGAGATRNALTKGMIEAFEVPAPSLEEQRAIASVLGALDDKIAQNRRTAQALEKLARAIFRAWFVDFEPVKAKAAGAKSFPSMPQPVFDALPTTFTNTDIGPVPEGWGVGALGDIISLYDSKRIPLSRRQREERPGSYRYYGATGIIDYVNDFLFDGEYVLIGEDGTVYSDGDLPMVQYVWGQFWVNNHAHVVTGVGGFSTEHIRTLLNFVNIRPFITGAVQLKLNQRNLVSVPVIIGTEDIVLAFGRVIEPPFALLRQLEDESRKLAEMRDYLLPKLLSGQVEVDPTNG